MTRCSSPRATTGPLPKWTRRRKTGSAIVPTPLPSSLRGALADDWQNGGFALYIHWPFCEAKCPYCDFNSHVARTIDQRAWRDAYLIELERAAQETSGRVLNAVFFGGGTPSLMDPQTVADIIAAIRKHWPTAN